MAHLHQLGPLDVNGAVVLHQTLHELEDCVAVALWHLAQMGNHQQQQHSLQLPDEVSDLAVEVQVHWHVGQEVAQHYLYGVDLQC